MNLSKELQDFFVENPTRTYGDGKIYSKHLRQKTAIKQPELVRGVLKMVERVIGNDMFMV